MTNRHQVPGKWLAILSLVFFRHRTDHDHGILCGTVLIAMFFTGQNEAKIALFNGTLLTAVHDDCTLALYDIVQVFKGVSVIGCMTAGHDRKYPEGISRRPVCS